MKFYKTMMMAVIFICIVKTTHAQLRKVDLEQQQQTTPAAREKVLQGDSVRQTRITNKTSRAQLRYTTTPADLKSASPATEEKKASTGIQYQRTSTVSSRWRKN